MDIGCHVNQTLLVISDPTIRTALSLYIANMDIRFLSTRDWRGFMADIPTFDANITLGALQIGVLVSYVLFGIMTMQAYIYYSRFPEDNRKLKSMVAFVWVCELAQAICIGHTLYMNTIIYYGHPEDLLLPPTPSFDISIFFSGAIAACVQGFFSFRIYMLSNRVLVPCITVGLAFLRFLADAVLFIGSLFDTSVADGDRKWTWLMITAWTLSAANDVAITTSLVYLLHRARGQVFSKTTVMIDKVIAWTIETGMITSIFSVVTMACFLKMKTNFIWIALFAISSRLFSNSLVASLNSRTALRAVGNEVTHSFNPTTTPVINVSGMNPGSLEMGKMNAL
ncbi:hypothetical protein MVEN_02231800 [Mycena venus]|uniref:DUF6534 domain-containing protein n=1 Tax=Mycena venus TaxID=2733690 RepID=A0A8H6X857_9AGAR|nr:hypothetical protein MVEN_02231800 [Mycena venus]